MKKDYIMDTLEQLEEAEEVAAELGNN